MEKIRGKKRGREREKKDEVLCSDGGAPWVETVATERQAVGGEETGWRSAVRGVLARAAALGDGHLWLRLQLDVDH